LKAIQTIEKLIPWPTLSDIAKVLDKGSSKEGKGVLTCNRSVWYYLWKCIKHLLRGLLGFRYDHNSGASHFAHAIVRFIQFCMVFTKEAE